MRKQNGITLIALVISIIVMLILAGVSINAVVGDNGVIGKAQETLYLQSCAVLEEFLQMEASNYALEENPYGTQYGLLKAKNPGWFYQNAQGYILDSDGHVLYLIRKSGLPQEIQGQLTGGDATKVSQYYKQVDVYGVTSDLQVYYCNNGTDTILGLTIEDLEKDDPLEIAYDEESLLSKVVNGTNEEGKANEALSTQDLKSIKTLTIDTTEKLALLNEFIKLPTLQTVYFSGITIPSLNGIQNAPSITEVRFTNCSVSDYSAMCGLTKLNKLYLIKPVGKNAEVTTLCSSDKGIATAEFTNLRYFGIVGSATYIQSTSTSYNTTRYDVTDISGMVNLSKITKEAIQYMYLQNLQLTSIASLSDFINVSIIRLEENALTTFEGLQNMSKLTYLIAPNLYSDTTSLYTLGINEIDTQNNSTDALSYIYKDENGKNSNLYYVDLRNAKNLKWTNYLANCSGVRYLYLTNNTSIKDASTIATIIGNCGNNYEIPATNTLEIIADNSVKLNFSGLTLTIEQFEKLMNNSNLKYLSLANMKLVDNSNVAITGTAFNEEVNKVLGTCSSLYYLLLTNLADLTTMEFVKGTPSLTKIDLYGTNVITNGGDKTLNGLELLEDYCAVKNIRLNNANIDLGQINNTVVRCAANGDWGRDNQFSIYGFEGLDIENATCMATINNCSGFTIILMEPHYNNFLWDLSDETSLTEVTFMWGSSAKVILPECVKKLEFNNEFYGSVDISRVKHFELISTGQFGMDNLITRVLNTYNPDTIIDRFNVDGRNLKTIDFTFLEPLNLKCKTFSVSYHAGDKAQSQTTKGIESIQGLISIEMDGLPYLTDISSLKVLTNLTNLKMVNCNIRDISAVLPVYNENNILISGMPNLTRITMYNNNISDISPLQYLEDLTYLHLSGNSINDVTPLTKLKKLETLNLQSNALYDNSYDSTGKSYYTLTVFSDLNQNQDGSLKNLYLSGNNIEEFSMLQDSNLKWDAKSGW